jgi:hypothetical protein
MPSPRRFDTLRGRQPEPEGPATRTLEDDIRDLFATPMGRRVLDGLIAETGQPCHVGAEDRALREREGARRFAADLRTRATSGRRRDRDSD